MEPNFEEVCAVCHVKRGKHLASHLFELLANVQELGEAEPPEFKSFGPTRTVDWLRCPTYERFNRSWEPQADWKPHMTMGAAIGEAVNQHLFGNLDALKAGLGIIEARFEEQDNFTKEGLSALLEKCFKVVVKTTAKDILAIETPIDKELTIGAGRIDLVTRDKRTNDLIVTDHKSKLQLKPEWVNANLVEIETDWQLLDYAWRVSEYYGEPALWIRRHLIVFSPTSKSYLWAVRLRPEAIKQWRVSADRIWADMERDNKLPLNELPMRLTECQGRFGRCPAYAACHDLYRDESAIASIYKRKVGSKK